MSVKFKYLKQLEKDLKNLEYHQRLYKLLRDELNRLGHWRNKPRGNPSKGYKVMKERTERQNTNKENGND